MREAPTATYRIKNSTKGSTNYVLMDLEICSCEAGKSGTPCKHMCAVVQQFKLSSSLIHPLLQCDPTMKKVLFEVAHGHTNVTDEWFAGLFYEVNNFHESEPGPTVSEQLTDVCPIDVPDTWSLSLFDKLNVAEKTQVSESVVRTSSNAETSLDEQNPNSNHAENDDGSTTTCPPEVLQKTEDGLRMIFDKYIETLETDPTTFLDPFNVFIKQNKMLDHSQSGLVSALHSFGKGLGTSAYGCHKRKNKGNIPIQSTSKARRKTYFGGTKAQFTGRPPKAIGSAGVLPSHSDHSYVPPSSKRNINDSEPVWSSLPKRKFAAPHRLQLCVDTSQMVGSTHSRK